MGLTYNTYLNADRVFGCKKCKAHLATHDSIISRLPPAAPATAPSSPGSRLHTLCSSLAYQLTALPLRQHFRGQHGKAYLFSHVVNILEMDPAERNMTTGRHIVRDIRCRQCSEMVGWKYDKAYEQTEKYKEGKFILEAELLCSVQ